MANFNDTFTAANGTLLDARNSDSGDSYSSTPGAKIFDNHLYYDNTATKYAIVSGFTGDNEFTIDINSKCVTDSDYIGVAFSATIFSDSLFNGYLIRLAPSRTIQLYRFSGGSPTLLGDYIHGVADGNPLALLKVTVTGAGIVVNYGGTDVITSGDGTYRTGGLAMWGFGAVTTTTGYHMNDVTYTVGVASGNPPVIDTVTTTAITSTNVDVGFNTDDPTGTAYVYLSANETEPTDQHIVDESIKSQAIVASGAITIPVTALDGLKDGANYYAHVVHENVAGLSNILSSALFSIPTLSTSYTGGAHTLSGTVTAQDDTTDTDTGTLTVPIVGSVSTELGALDVNAVGEIKFIGSVSSELGALNTTAVGEVVYTGTVSSELGTLNVSGTGTVLNPITGSATVELGALNVSAAGTVTPLIPPVTGTVSTELGALDVTASGLVVPQGTITGSVSTELGSLTVSGTGTVTNPSGGGLTQQDIDNIVNAIFSRIVENGETFEQLLRLMRAESLGLVTVGDGTVSFRDAADSKNRIVATVTSDGDRTNIVTDGD